VVDSQPSSNMDDLFGFGVPGAEYLSSTPQYSSRREARAAQVVASPAEIVPAMTAPTSELAVAAVRSEAPTRASRKAASDRKPRTPPKDPNLAQAPAGPAGRKLKPAELALMRASHPKPPRKKPFSVLITMVAVGGMFAVAGLPAYALAPVTNATNSTTQADPQSVFVSTNATALTVTRDGYHATSQDQLDEIQKDALRAQQNEAYNASGARAMGDDYPWPYELMEGQGGGLSPLNYYYRECVDFVAWRLNRDAGSYQAPFKWVWSNLTPSGGDGSQWMYNWEQHGWPVSNVPIVGAVAYTGGNHVAYVKRVNGDGTVTIEEYNYIHGQYGQRTLPSTSIVAFLYPPPS
jgi:surface antigen